MTEKKKGEIIPREEHSFSGMMRRFDRMFDDFRREFEDLFERPLGLRRHLGWGKSLEEFSREPLVDLIDQGDHFDLSAEIPGIPKDKINIKVAENFIEIKAEIEEEKEEKEKDYLSRERSSRKFYRKMSLPEEVIPDKAKAKEENGILKITLPKKKPVAAPTTKQITID